MSDKTIFLGKDTRANVALIRFDVTQFVNLGQVPSKAPFFRKLPAADLALVRPLAVSSSSVLCVRRVIVSVDR